MNTSVRINLNAQFRTVLFWYSSSFDYFHRFLLWFLTCRLVARPTFARLLWDTTIHCLKMTDYYKWYSLLPHPITIHLWSCCMISPLGRQIGLISSVKTASLFNCAEVLILKVALTSKRKRRSCFPNPVIYSAQYWCSDSHWRYSLTSYSINDTHWGRLKLHGLYVTVIEVLLWVQPGRLMPPWKYRYRHTPDDIHWLVQWCHHFIYYSASSSFITVVLP